QCCEWPISSAAAMTGCVLARACLLAWRLGDESQHRVPPQVWQVRRCTHDDPILTHSSHSRFFACFTDLISRICAQTGELMTPLPFFRDSRDPIFRALHRRHTWFPEKP